MATAMTSAVPLGADPVDLSYDEFCELATSGEEWAVKARIYPDVAKAILAGNNARNRKVRKSNVRYLQQQIADGLMVYNGEGIQVGSDGNINNGQHRLRAGAESGKPIVVLMVFGVEPSAFATYDTGSSRTGSDVLAIEGKSNTGRLAAALKHLHYYEQGRLGADAPNGGVRKGNGFVLELYEQFHGIDESVRKTASFPKRITRPSLAAALHYLFSQKDRTAADQFIDIVRDGLLPGRDYDLTLAENARQLRRWLEDNNSDTKRKPPLVAIANVWIKAWNSFRKRTVRKLLMHKSNSKQVEIV